MFTKLIGCLFCDFAGKKIASLAQVYEGFSNQVRTLLRVLVFLLGLKMFCVVFDGLYTFFLMIYLFIFK